MDMFAPLVTSKPLLFSPSPPKNLLSTERWVWTRLVYTDRLLHIPLGLEMTAYGREPSRDSTHLLTYPDVLGVNHRGAPFGVKLNISMQR